MDGRSRQAETGRRAVGADSRSPRATDTGDRFEGGRSDPFGQRLPPRGRAAKPASAPERYRYTIADLEELTGVSARTIRYYITQGLAPPAHGRGPSATYDLGHLLRLRAIQMLKEQRLPLDAIRERLERLADDDIAAMLHVATAPPQDRWRRILLHPAVELHVREQEAERPDLAMERAIERIQEFAQDELDRLG